MSFVFRSIQNEVCCRQFNWASETRVKSPEKLKMKKGKANCVCSEIFSRLILMTSGRYSRSPYSRQTEFVITQITYWKLGGRLFFFQWNRAYVIMIWSLRKSFIKQIQYRYPPSHYCFQILAGKGVSYLLLYHLIR